MHSFSLRSLMVGLLVTLGVACANVEAPSNPNLGSNPVAVVGGDPSSLYEAAGYVYFERPSKGWWYFCSATLVGERWVLTSAHCMNPESFPIDDPGVSIVFGIGSDWANPIEEVPVTAYTVHPEWVPDTGLVSAYQWDLSLMELESTPETPLRPIAVNTSPLTEAHEGSVLYSYTYGAESLFYSYTESTDDDFGVKQEGIYKIKEIAPDGMNFLTIEWSPRGSDALCTADSGGALLKMVNGDPTVVATQSILTGGVCRTGTDYAPLTETHACWLDEVSSGEVLFTLNPTCP